MYCVWGLEMPPFIYNVNKSVLKGHPYTVARKISLQQLTCRSTETMFIIHIHIYIFIYLSHTYIYDIFMILELYRLLVLLINKRLHNEACGY